MSCIGRGIAAIIIVVYRIVMHFMIHYSCDFAQGITPLLAALTASSPGVSVVNIDNGFGAGMLAARMLRMAARLRAKAQGQPA
jgi:NCAIR mutase (PurE)-related protein